MKNNLTLHEQIAFVQKYGESSRLRTIGIISLAVMIVTLVAFIQSTNETQKVFLLFISGCGGMIFLATFSIYPHLQQAARATRSGIRVPGTLHLLIIMSDSDYPNLSGTMQEGLFTWHLRFSQPIGWQPTEGQYPCDLVFLADQTNPVLAVLPSGILIPTKISQKT